MIENSWPSCLHLPAVDLTINRRPHWQAPTTSLGFSLFPALGLLSFRELGQPGESALLLCGLASSHLFGAQSSYCPSCHCLKPALSGPFQMDFFLSLFNKAIRALGIGMGTFWRVLSVFNVYSSLWACVLHMPFPEYPVLWLQNGFPA